MSWPKKGSTFERRFWEKVSKTNGCWLWIGGKLPAGYGFGARRKGGERSLAHRQSWEMHFGKIPHGMDVCHRCDNPPCVKPSHLFLGTRRENVLDMIKKGRANNSAKGRKGSENGNAFFSVDEARKFLKEYYSSSLPAYKLAKKFGISRWLAANIIQGKWWGSAEI